MNLRQALIEQAPSLELQRAAQAEIARLDVQVNAMHVQLDEFEDACADSRSLLLKVLHVFGTDELRCHERNPETAKLLSEIELHTNKE